MDDTRFLVLNKPPGLATQGGTRVGGRHLEALLPCLDGGKFWLVHRLDKEVSGAMVVARDVGAAAALADHFKHRRVTKTYWALVTGAVPSESGTINVDIDGRPSETEFRVVEDLGGFGSWLALRPLTGRKHQLRIHCAVGLKCPILGERRYDSMNGALQLCEDELAPQGIGDLAAPGLHLHARDLAFPKLTSPRAKSMKRYHAEIIRVEASLPSHMKCTWDQLGLVPRHGDLLTWK
jgi:23S rRNA pseudouridine955/2504/2580 synthase